MNDNRIEAFVAALNARRVTVALIVVFGVISSGFWTTFYIAPHIVEAWDIWKLLLLFVAISTASILWCILSLFIGLDIKARSEAQNQELLVGGVAMSAIIFHLVIANLYAMSDRINPKSIIQILIFVHTLMMVFGIGGFFMQKWRARKIAAQDTIKTLEARIALLEGQLQK